MASITREKNGRRTIQFVAADGKRRSIRLGKMSQRQAEAVKVKVEQLAAAAISGHAVDAETSRWVAGLDFVMADKLARVGLMAKRETSTLETYIVRYIKGRTDVKSSTEKKYQSTRKALIQFFGKDRNLRDITPGDADEWRLRLLSQNKAENTIRKHVAVAKLFFNAAVRKRIIHNNPFGAGLSTCGGFSITCCLVLDNGIFQKEAQGWVCRKCLNRLSISVRFA